MLLTITGAKLLQSSFLHRGAYQDVKFGGQIEQQTAFAVLYARTSEGSLYYLHDARKPANMAALQLLNSVSCVALDRLRVPGLESVRANG